MPFATTIVTTILFSFCVYITEATSLWGWNISKDYYIADFPTNSSFSVNAIPNSCGAGPLFDGGGDIYSFACPHMLMFSEDMIRASVNDNLSWAYYATAGSNSDDDCGKCFHVRPSSPEKWTSNVPFQDMIVQVINSGGDVGFTQFDIFLGAGGFGVYTAANSDCNTRYCDGGSCHAHMYAGSFYDWTNAEYASDTNACYAGGVKWFAPYNDTSSLETLCGNLFRGESKSIFKNEQLYRSCYLSNTLAYHQNFRAYMSSRVQCPRGLYMLTGIRRKDDIFYNLPSEKDDLSSSTCTDSLCMTTMMDNCRVSCSWSGKVETFDDFPAVFTCDAMGIPFNLIQA